MSKVLKVAIATTLWASAAASAMDTTDKLDEVVVTAKYTTGDQLDTATGLGLSIMETPQSVTVMTFERILDQNLRSLSDVVLNAPGLSSKELDSSRHTFSARGFSIDNYQIDGVPMEWSSGGDAGETESDTALYERVEIVRGATGLLTGTGNPSASINLVRKHASSRELEGFATLGYGRWDQLNAMVDVGAPLGFDGNLRGRAVLNYEDGDSFTDLLGNRKTVGYAVIEGDVTQSTLLRAGYSHQDNDPTASTWGGLPSWYADGTRTDFPRSKTIGAHWTRWASTNRNYFLTAIQQLGERWELRADYNNARNDAELNLLYLYGQPDRETGEGLGPSPYRSDTSRKQYNVGFRISGEFDLFGRTHELTAGYSQTKQTFLLDSADADPGTIADVGNFNVWDGSYPEPTYVAPVIQIDQETKQRGFYLATRLAITDTLKAVLGGRLTTWDQTGVSYTRDVDYGDSNVLVPYAGLLFDVTEAHRIYASYTEIFKPQESYDINNVQLDPVTGIAYEAGVKSAFMSGALHTTVAVFRIQQDNLAEGTGVMIPGVSPPREASRAIDGAQTEGYEIEIVGRPLPGLEATLSYTDFTAENAESQPINTDQPRKLFKLFVTYQLVDLLPALTIGGGVNWESNNYVDPLFGNPVTGEPERLEQDAYALVNLMVRYKFGDHLSAQLNIHNALDEKYYGQIGFYDQLSFGEPRNFNLGVTYRF